VIRDELARSYTGLQVMKYNGMRMLTNLVRRGTLGPEASIGKLFWTTWHRDFGEVAMDVLGADAMQIASATDGVYDLDEVHQIFMASRAETIYAGSSEIQRNIIGERVLGLPREPKQQMTGERQ
jgi:alkylation response protein AidB-like acyl-CoA dehydrogenase